MRETPGILLGIELMMVTVAGVKLYRGGQRKR